MRPPSDPLATASTVPGWRREPGLTEPAQGTACSVRVGPLEEQSVERRAGSGDVRAEGAVDADLHRERGAHKVVHRQDGEVSGPFDAREPVEQRLAPIL